MIVGLQTTFRSLLHHRNRQFVVALANGGLILNEDKTTGLTTKTQPPKTTTPRGVSVVVVDRSGCHKWLGCIVSGYNKGSHKPDLEYHLPAASKAFLQTETFLETFFATRPYACTFGVLTWSQRSLQRYWHLCSYIVGLPNARWVSRILVWRCRNTGKRGGPFRLWHSTAETICR